MYGSSKLAHTFMQRLDNMDLLIYPCSSFIKVCMVEFVNLQNVAYRKLDPSKTGIQDWKNTPKLFRDHTPLHTVISLKLCPETLHNDFSYRTPPQGYRCSRPRSLTRRQTQTSTCVLYLPTSRRTMPLIPTPPPRGGTWIER